MADVGKQMMPKALLILLMSLLAGQSAEAAIPLAPLSGQSLSPSVYKLVYRVQHSKYGTLGTFTNTIRKAGDATTVTTDAHYKVGALGVTFYRQDVSRVEVWSRDRLMGFHSVTSVNGQSIELNGMAEGNQFVLMTPEGTVAAPADVRLANPWCLSAVEGEMMLTPDKGRLEMVMLTDMDDTTLRIGAKTIHARHFAVIRGAGPRKYEIWVDDRDTPVQFSVVAPTDTITFTLMG
jgi:hypothetical protein